LYDDLVRDGLLIEHTERTPRTDPQNAPWLVIQPREVAFVSYPYEWCFSALKDAASLTLEIQRRALAKGMSLKDASAFNVQFEGGLPIFIDTLSLEAYRENRPWVAYGQFCRHFLAPLAVMAHGHVDLGRLFQSFLDGIPLSLASAMLPRKTWLKPGLLVHLHGHARCIDRHSSASADTRRATAAAARLPRRRLVQLVEHLAETVSSLTWAGSTTEWIEGGGSKTVARTRIPQCQPAAAGLGFRG
jgi:hypothetical protein